MKGLAACLPLFLLFYGGRTTMPPGDVEETGYRIDESTDSETNWRIYELSYRDPNSSSHAVTARIVPEAGSNLISLRVGGMEILHTPPTIARAAGVGFGVPVLYPTPNRVRDSRFTFEGRTFEFKPNERNNFIHGLVNRAAWKAGESKATATSATLETSVEFEPGFSGYQFFPIRNRLRMKFSLQPDGMLIQFEVTNLDKGKLPFGLAVHPYFKVLGDRIQTFIRVPAQFHMQAEGLLPTGMLEPIDGSRYDLRSFASIENLVLDDVYSGMTPINPATYECRDARVRVTLEASDLFTHAVVYTPRERPYFCIENQTCATDAHNLYARGLEKESHLVVLDPGKSATGSIRIRVVHY